MTDSPPIPIRPTTGFTVMELLVALALSTVVAVAAMSVFGMLPAAEDRLSQRFDDRLDLLITQDVVRKATDSLVAARPLSQAEIDEMRNEAIVMADRIESEQEDDEDEDAEEEDDQEQEDADDVEDQSVLDDEAVRVLAEIYLESDRDDSVLDDLIVQSSLSGQPNFELHFTRNQYDTILPRLELVLHEAPVAERPSEFGDDRRRGIPTTGRIRGAFELIELDDELLLMWQPIEPSGLGTIIKDDLAWIEWWVLPRRGNTAAGAWDDVHASYLEQDYPLAIRLVMWTLSGEHVDWLFQVEAATPTQRQ